MSLAENLLNTLPDDNDNTTRISNAAEEPHITVNEDRTITIPKELRTIAVVGDKNVETVTFDCVRYWDGHDLSTFAIYLNYTLPNGVTGTYIPTGIRRSADYYSFDWTIDRIMTGVAGSLEIALSAIQTDSNGAVQRQWGSLPNSDMVVAHGLPISNIPDVEEETDILSQILSELGDKLSASDLAQTPGDSETDAMSQKATTRELDDIRSNITTEATPVYNKYAGTSYIELDGDFSPLNGFSVSDPIEIPEGAKQVCFIGVPMQQYMFSLAFFDTDNPEGARALSGYKCTEYVSEYTYIDIPESATHFFTCKEDALGSSGARYYFTLDIKNRLIYTEEQVSALEVDIEALEVDIEALEVDIEAQKSIIDTMFTSVSTELLNYITEPAAYFDTSTFSAWKVSDVAKSKMMCSSVTFRVKARDTAITQMLCQLEVNSTKIEKTIDVNIEAGDTGDVTFDLGRTVIIQEGDVLALGYKCNHLCDMIGARSSLKPTVWYDTKGRMDGSVWLEATALVYPYIRLNLLELKNANTDTEGNIKLKLPSKYDLVVGDNFELFYKGILNALNPEQFDFEITINTGNHGYGFKRKYTWTPTAANVGQHTMTIKVRNNNGDIVDEGSVTLNVVNKPTSPTGNKVVLCIGDSLTEGGVWCAEFYRRLTANDGSPIGYGLSNIQFVGEKTKGGANYVGYGGWTFNSYLSESKSDSVMHIYGTFDKTDSDQHSVYKDANGVQWKLETIGASTIKIIRTSSSGTLPASGALTWVSGGVNTNAINYISSEQAAGNPFWNSSTQAVDFAWYAQQKGVVSIDYCNILLGWNSSTETEESYKAQVRTFLDKLLSAFPNCKVSLMGLQVPSRDGFGHNYGVSWKYYDKLQWVWTISKWYAEIAEEEAYSANVEYVNISGQFDTDNNMLTDTVQVNNRNTATEVRQSNGVHPAQSGSLQIADAALRNFVAKI